MRPHGRDLGLHGGIDRHADGVPQRRPHFVQPDLQRLTIAAQRLPKEREGRLMVDMAVVRPGTKDAVVTAFHQGTAERFDQSGLTGQLGVASVEKAGLAHAQDAAGRPRFLFADLGELALAFGGHGFRRLHAHLAAGQVEHIHRGAAGRQQLDGTAAAKGFIIGMRRQHEHGVTGRRHGRSDDSGRQPAQAAVVVQTECRNRQVASHRTGSDLDSVGAMSQCRSAVALSPKMSPLRSG